MVERGLARWTDVTRSAFGYTLFGALRIVLVQFLGQFATHALTSTGRASRPRPGDVPTASGFPMQQPIPPTRAWGPSTHAAPTATNPHERGF